MKGSLDITYGARANSIRGQLVEYRQNYGDRDIAGESTSYYYHAKQHARTFGNETILATPVQKAI